VKKTDPVAKIQEKFKGPEFHGVLDDLVAFTGLTQEKVCQRVLESRKRIKEEFRWVRPKGPVEYDLFYRCCREYLFTNAYRRVWPMLDGWNDPDKGPVLDFAGGMGNDTVWLAEGGFDVDYHEIGIVQREFVRFRIARRGLTNVEVIDPYVGGKYEPLKCVAKRGYMYGAVLLRDVLEHAPNYADIVRTVCARVRQDGVVMEHTLWASMKEKKNPLHLDVKVPLKALFSEMGFESAGRGMWRKK